MQNKVSFNKNETLIRHVTSNLCYVYRKILQLLGHNNIRTIEEVKVMRRYILVLGIGLSLVFLAACGKDTNDQKESPTPEPTLPVEQVTPGPIETEDMNQDETGKEEDRETEDTYNSEDDNALNIRSYYPFVKDTEYVYEGEGMEYASFHVIVDYYDEASGRIQTRTDNGGTVTAKVIEVKDGELSLIKSIGEFYYRDNLLATKAGEEAAEILLMEPLKEGTSWKLPDGSKRYISKTDVKIETKLGSFETIEVTTEYEESTIREYYAPNVGMIKSIFNSEDYEVTSTLSEIKKNKPHTQTLEIFYPGKDEKIHVEEKTITFHTNDVTRFVLEKEIKEELQKEEYLPLITTNTKINSLYLCEDNIVYVDFSRDLIAEMNAGAGYEQLILQSITNTLGNYYGAQEVYITVDGKPYESGHILLKKGETLKVNLDAVVR